MRFKVQIVSVSDEGRECSVETVLDVERTGLSAENLGLMLAESKQLLTAVQDFVVEHQVEG